jgi:predicted TIM-barrel fold metal-dependent hydrolase
VRETESRPEARMPAAPTPPALPAGACDCHTHVFEPDRFPYWSGRAYTPPAATAADLARHLDRLGLERVLLVQPSVYGTDTRAHAAAIGALGQGRARGIAVIDPATTTAADIDRLHAEGFRGVRLNVKTAAITAAAPVVAAFEATERLLAGRGWAIQIFAGMDLIAGIAARLAAAQVPVILDHYALADPAGLDPLARLLETGHVYVKLSAAYRVDTAPDYPRARALTRALVAHRPDRLMWGSDWPHPGGGAPGTRTDPCAIEPLLAVDDAAALALMLEWLGTDALRRLVLAEVPDRLFFRA